MPFIATKLIGLKDSSENHEFCDLCSSHCGICKVIANHYPWYRLLGISPVPFYWAILPGLQNLCYYERLEGIASTFQA